MVVGIDTYHDSVKKGASVVGFVASLVHTWTRFYSRTVIQKPNQELSDHFTFLFEGKTVGHGRSQQGVWVPFWTPKPLKTTPQDTQFF